MTVPGFSFIFDTPYDRYYNRNGPGGPNYAYGQFDDLLPGLMQVLNIRQMVPGAGESGPKMKSNKNKFQVSAQVKAFAPEDLSVKTVDGFVIIRAKHGERKDSQGGWVSRDFMKKYQLPEGCAAEDVQCRLSPSGLLTVFVPFERNLKSNEREVPIIFTDPTKDIKDTEIKVEVKETDQKSECADEEAYLETPVKNEE
ncbi:unnamed protein product [Arctia plantaginis]|uniref:SHSP domain-containing protein n=1 Tax=Arctia plantaginis TaxID=874455 RepID=A0A8S1A9B4_ARCPL|nr:unnamed protein product [Arctia plantaginis]CAB3256205.1 unnamed protein product [Arctia plantaginis]